MTPELKVACEEIFQEHKAKNNSLSWTRKAAHGGINTGMVDLAKEILLEKHIIYYPNPAKKLITRLNPEVVPANSFAEAERILVHGKPVSAPINNHESNKPTIEKPALVKEDKPTIERPALVKEHKPTSSKLQPIDPSKKESVSKPKWYTRSVFVYVIWPLLGAIVFFLIAYLIGTGYEELFLKKRN